MRPVQSELIFDVGMHRGEDTAYYLARGFRVVAADADPRMVEIARATFSVALANGQLTLLNIGASDKDDEEVDFYLSDHTEWSSLRKSISDRKNLHRQTIKVKTRTIPSLIKEYGLPYYCKIDIEGYDAVCLKTLS